MTIIQNQCATEDNKSGGERKKTVDNKAKIPIRLPKHLEKLSKQIDRIRKIDGDESMFRSRFRLPYSSPKPVRPQRKA